MKIEKLADIRRKIIKEASKLFIYQGYNKTTIREIANVSGVGRGHLYYYFRKKEDILLYLYKDLLERIYKLISESYNHGSEPLVNYAISQCVYTHIIASSKELFRMYIEGSSIDVVRKEYINILIDLFNEKLEGTDYSFNKKDIYLSTTIGCSGESELLNRYYNGEDELDLTSIVESTIKTRLLLLNIESRKVESITKEAIRISNSLNTEELISMLGILHF